MVTFIATDIDGTACPWKPKKFGKEVYPTRFKNNVKAFKAADKEGDIIAFATGANQTSVKESAQFTNQIPAQYWITDNGSTIHQNTHGTLVKLKEWQNFLLKQYQWSCEKVSNQIQHSLKQHGFKKVKSQSLPTALSLKVTQAYRRGLFKSDRLNKLFNTYIYAKFVPNGTVLTFQVRHHNRPWNIRYAQYLGKKVTRDIKKALNIPDMTTLHKHYPIWEVYIFEHAKVGKSAAVEFLTKLINPQAVITLDDNSNGVDMLEKSHYTDKQGHQIPNYAVITGDHINEMAVKRKNPLVIKTKVHGDIGDALTQQRKKIKEDLETPQIA